MEIRRYRDTDWESVRDIYDISKPDEMRGSVDLRAIFSLEADPEMKVLFQESSIRVMKEAGQIVGFGGNRGSYISWLFVHPGRRRQGIAAALLREIVAHLDGAITLRSRYKISVTFGSAMASALLCYSS